MKGLGKTTPRDMRAIVKIARDQAWDVDRTARGHWRFCPPKGQHNCVITSGTPGTQRSVRHLIAHLRRRGLTL